VQPVYVRRKSVLCRGTAILSQNYCCTGFWGCWCFGLELHGGALLVWAGSAVVESSSFIGNSILDKGGAIAVNNAASLKLVASVVKGNH
jgi:hypothetical protein